MCTSCTETRVFDTCLEKSYRWVPPGGSPPAETGAGSWTSAYPGSPAEELQTHQKAEENILHDT